MYKLTPSRESIRFCGLNSTVKTFIFKTRQERRSRYDCLIWHMKRAWISSLLMPCPTNLIIPETNERTRRRCFFWCQSPSLWHNVWQYVYVGWLQAQQHMKSLCWRINLRESKCLKHKQRAAKFHQKRNWASIQVWSLGLWPYLGAVMLHPVSQAEPQEAEGGGA